MSSRPSFFRSSVGSKYLIGFTGLCLVGFLVLHMAGNVLVLISPEVFNTYGDRMIKNPLLIPAEIGLLLLFVMHVYKTVRMWLGAREARPDGYARKEWARRTSDRSRKSWASTTMILSGLFLLIFVPLHLATFKYGAHYLVEGQPGVRDLHRLVVEVFSKPGYAIYYAIGMVIVGFHLWHGVSSSFQSLGVASPRLSARLRLWGWIVAVVIAGGFFIIPVWIFLGSRV